MTKFSLDNLRLAIKGLATLWIPILAATGIIPANLASMGIMAASTASVDLLFRIWGIGDASGPTG